MKQECLRGRSPILAYAALLSPAALADDSTPALPASELWSASAPRIAERRVEERATDDEDEDEDESGQPTSPRDGTTFTITLPLGVGGGPSGVGFAYGISGAIGGGAFSLPIHLEIANNGDAGGMYEIGIRYSAPKLFFAELLVGYVKADASYGASLGAGGGLGLDIPVYKHFTITVGADVSYAFAQGGVFALAYAGPTLHI